MLLNFLGQRLSLRPQGEIIILMFFIYSFLGYILECVVLSVEKKKLVLNRGFVKHLPFCIIYGFGAMSAFALLNSLRDNLILLFIVGAIAATIFELIVANLQLELFNNFWWDYSEKPFNYKGILCLESTLGWGFVAIFIVRYFHIGLARLIIMIPKGIITLMAVILFISYLFDFLYSSYLEKKPQDFLEKEI